VAVGVKVPAHHTALAGAVDVKPVVWFDLLIVSARLFVIVAAISLKRSCGRVSSAWKRARRPIIGPAS
jgi:hypothetical protein